MPARSFKRALSLPVLYSGFALTGFSTALIGATLPALLRHWNLSDQKAGTLFLFLFFGTSSGALLSRGRTAPSLLRGAVLLACSCVALAFAGPHTVLPLCLLYGLGLGITITSINLLRSERNPASLVAELNRLNLIWAAGAFLCPLVAGSAITVYGIRLLLLSLALLFAALAAWTLIVELPKPQPAPFRPPARGSSRLPLVIALLTLLATGFESSSGAWLATYASRLNAVSSYPIAAASVFWFGLLASRALHTTRLVRGIAEPALLRNAAALAATGGVLLVTTQAPWLLLLAALLIGLGIGPVYPLLVAAALPRYAGNTIFLMAGLGGAIFPWLIGTVSAHTGSLRSGMLLPALAGLTLFALVVVQSRRLTPVA